MTPHPVPSSKVPKPKTPYFHNVLIINKLYISGKYMCNVLIFNEKFFKKSGKKFGRFGNCSYLYYVIKMIRYV